ncbi:unnamed protein product [Rodentolepis nana]|uniref:BZIP_Maf domain-containing protein n=1 Tax=Rodentolepis nana TaxID=102285 RepID=A0A0R3T544_RODNA|nr:unnamed protein product [Rodentolepis nana]
METKSLSIIKCLLSILLIEEIVAFVLRTGTYAIKTLLHLYCAKLFCLYSLPLKRLAIAPPGDFQVRVLLTELYPDCYTRRGAGCRSNEDLLIEDYLIYLQKFGFDDPEEAQIDELNVMFQANHLPLSVFQSNGQNHDRDSGVCPALPTPTTSKNCSYIKPERFDLDQNPTRSIVTADQEQDNVLLSSTHHEDDSRVTNLDTESSENIETFDHPVILYSKKSAKPLTNGGNIVGGSRLFYLDSPSAQSNHNGFSCKHNNSIHRMYAGPISDPTSLSRSPHSPSQNVLKSLSNVHPGSQSSCTSVVPQPKIVKLGYVWPRYDKPRVRVLSQDSTSLSDSHSSDNSRDISVWDRAIREEDGTGLADLFEDSDSEGTLKEEDDEEEEDEEEQEEVVDEYEDEYKYYSALKSSPSTSSGSYPRLSRTSDRNIRDVNILKSLGVPFSYDEVAYSSNELFREMKSKPGLSFEQISAMLDARRRATNRAAADRCRRMKSQARNSLATKLGRLRLRSTHLNRRMINTRKTRQWKRDRVSAIERGLIRMLTDDKGIPLDPSKWRIHLTANGDVVIMNLESSLGQFGNDRTVNFLKVEPV